MTNYECRRALVYLAEEIIKTFGKDVGVQEPKQEPAEPYVEDEKIRKIIRAWADENDTTRVVYYSPKNELVDSYGNSISFNLIFRKLNHGAEYTVDELCGEKETPEPLEPNFIDLDERIKEKAATEKLYKGENDMHLTEERE